MDIDFARVSFYTWEQKKRRARKSLFFIEEIMFKKDATTTRREFVKSVGALAGATLLLGQTTLSAHAESSREVEPSHPSRAGINVLLAHGAYVDASNWSKVIPLLQAKGYNTLAVQLPLASFQEDVTTTEQALASLTGPTILVGHSYAGSVISNVGSHVSNLVGLVYVAAFAPEEGGKYPKHQCTLSSTTGE